MSFYQWVKRILLVSCLLACQACTPSGKDFAQISGYDSQGVRTGSVLPIPGTLTPY